jgi:hypothetical protein
MRFGLPLLFIVLLSPGRTDEYVTVHGWVEDARRVLVHALEPAEFEAVIDDVAVPLAAVEPRTASMSIIVLLDVSRSVRWESRPLDQQLEAFISSLNDADRVMIATCCGRTSFGAFRTARDDVRGEVRAALDLDEEEGFAGSPIWDAMHEAITILSRQPAPRALILMSDGRSSGNRHGLSDVADHAMAHGVSVNVVAKHSTQHLYQAGDTVAIVQPTTPLEAVTRYTGGFLFTYPEGRQQDARTMFEFAASLLRGLHAFRFAPRVRDGKPHRLEIRSKTPGVRVYAPIAFVAR